MAELPVTKRKGEIGLNFSVYGRAEGMLMSPDPMASIPDNLEVVVRRAGDCVEVVTRPRGSGGRPTPASVCERCEVLEEALRRIVAWADAYPADIFHEPSSDECHRAHKLLAANGMTMDAFSASMGRHCLKGVGNIARGALGE